MSTVTRPYSQTRLLRATPETVHWGYLDATMPPALTIESGERVRIECVTGGPDWLPPKDRSFDLFAVGAIAAIGRHEWLAVAGALQRLAAGSLGRPDLPIAPPSP